MKSENIKPQNFCTETESMIDEYLEGMISLSDKTIMDEHFAGCEECKRYLRDTESLVKDLGALSSAGIIISAKKKDDLWKNVESKIDKDKYAKEKIEKEKSANQKEATRTGYLHKYRYILSGVAAAVIIGFLVYGIKDMKINNDRLAQQNSFGLASYWKVSNLQGNPLVGDVAMGSSDSIKEGQWIQTDFDSRAELIVSNIGKVIIEPNSKVLFLKGAAGDNRIQVVYGTINTDMNPNSKTFFVEMPSAVATDNGGSYTMTVDHTGDGLVFVRSGKVDVESQNREAVVPAGSLVLTRKNFGVGTPFNESSSDNFKSALFNYDFGNCSGACVATLLKNAKVSDAVTLLNLMPRIESEYKDKVYAKLANFVTPPARVRSDSLRIMNEDEINEWIDKIQMEVQESVERNMKDVEKNLEELKKLEHIDLEKLHALENLPKHFEFNDKFLPDENYVWEIDSIEFDKEQLRLDIEEMKKEIQENTKFNKEQLKVDMDELKEDLKELKENLKLNFDLNNDELKKGLEDAKKQLRKALEDVDSIDFQDSVHRKMKFRFNDKDNIENIEEPDNPEAPEIQEEPKEIDSGIK